MSAFIRRIDAPEPRLEPAADEGLVARIKAAEAEGYLGTEAGARLREEMRALELDPASVRDA